MDRINRYVLIELTKVFLVALFALTLLMLIVGMVHEGMRRDLAPGVIVQLIPYLLPEALRFTLPSTALFAATLVFGRLSANNEIVALKSMGINPLRVLWPTLYSAAVLSLLAFWMNDLAVSWGRAGVQRVVVAAIEEIIYGKLHADRSMAMGNFSITVKEIVDRTLIKPTVVFQSSGSTPAVTVTAESAELRYDPATSGLTFALKNGTAAGGGVQYYFESEERSAQMPGQSDDVSPSNMPLSRVPVEIAEKNAELQGFRGELATYVAFDLLVGNTPGLGGEGWNGHLGMLEGLTGHLARLDSEAPRRWSNGFSTLFFVIVGAPLAILRRRADFLTNFALCFIPILIVYYPLLAASVGWAKSGMLPGWSVWIGNALLGVWGGYLIHQVYRY